jgi:hypothetical protein
MDPGLRPSVLPVASIVYVNAPKLADGLWAAEQILRTGSFGALMLWLRISAKVISRFGERDQYGSWCCAVREL